MHLRRNSRKRLEKFKQQAKQTHKSFKRNQKHLIHIISVILLGYICRISCSFWSGIFFNSSFVLENAQDIYPHYDNPPIGGHRPKYQYVRNKRVDPEPAILTVLTVTRGPDLSSFYETVKFMKLQSLQLIRWIIVCDHIEETAIVRALQEVQNSDSRFVVKNNTGRKGVSNTRNAAIKHFLRAETKYVTFLDDDDQMELNAYEKLVWTLESNAKVPMALSYCLGFGNDNFTWPHGFHDGWRNLRHMYLTVTVMMRASNVVQSGCMFRDAFNKGFEDWEYFLCLASKGLWGVTVPEYLFWYRRNPISVRKERWPSLFERQQREVERIRDKYEFLRHRFPNVSLARTSENETLSMSLPFHNYLGARRAILLILPWIGSDAVNSQYLSIVRDLTRKSFAVTILCMERRSLKVPQPHTPFQRYTHDVFVLPSLLRLADIPRFVKYIIESRGIKKVIVSQSKNAYHLLPILKQELPDVVYIDLIINAYVTREYMEFARLTSRYSALFDATFVPSDATRSKIIDIGHSGANINVMPMNIPRPTMLSPDEREVRRARMKLSRDAFVVLFVGNLIDNYDVKAIINSLRSLMHRNGIRKDDSGAPVLILAGQGPIHPQLDTILKYLTDLSVRIYVNLRFETVLEYLQISDVLCYFAEDSTVSNIVTDAISLGVVPLVSRNGADGAFVGGNGQVGFYISFTGNSYDDENALLTKLNRVFGNDSTRMKIYQRGRLRLHRDHSPDKLSQMLVTRILSVKSRSTDKGKNRNFDYFFRQRAFETFITQANASSELPGTYKNIMKI